MRKASKQITEHPEYPPPPSPSAGDATLQRKRAAGESSQSEWSETSGDSDSESGSGDDDSSYGGGGARAKKEAAFAKVLQDVMDKRNSAEPGVLQKVWHDKEGLRSRAISFCRGDDTSCCARRYHSNNDYVGRYM